MTPKHVDVAIEQRCTMQCLDLPCGNPSMKTMERFLAIHESKRGLLT